jgi:hypothetical protein
VTILKLTADGLEIKNAQGKVTEFSRVKPK